jgi:hypothetical protein
MGHAAPFAFTDHYEPAPGIARFLVGTPPMLSLLALESGVETFAGADMEQLWAKSIALFDLFAARVAERCPELACISPADPERRGSHISFRHPHAFEICQALIADGVIGDFRAPDVIRFGLTPALSRLRGRVGGGRADGGDHGHGPLARSALRRPWQGDLMKWLVLIALVAVAACGQSQNRSVSTEQLSTYDVAEAPPPEAPERSKQAPAAAQIAYTYSFGYRSPPMMSRPCSAPMSPCAIGSGPHAAASPR